MLDLIEGCRLLSSPTLPLHQKRFDQRMGGLFGGDELEEVCGCNLPALGDRLADCGERDPGDCTDADIVVADDGYVVVGDENEGGLCVDVLFFDEGGDKIIAILLGLHLRVVDDIGMIDMAVEALQAIFDRLVVKASDAHDLLPSIIVDVQGGQLAAFFVVTADKGERGVGRDAVYHHKRDVGLGEQHPIDPGGDQGLDGEDAIDALCNFDEEVVLQDMTLRGFSAQSIRV